ncbi:MAG: thiamine-phosphate kinase [Neisseriaceae bacterium]
MDEFQFIQHYLVNKQTWPDTFLELGIGDDAAILRMNSEQALCISADMLQEGVHFFATDLPQDIAYKAVAVNFSDMAAMGVRPRWLLLTLALPVLEKVWLDAFFDSFYSLLEKYRVKLIGGDTTRGTCTISITVMGENGTKGGLRRDQAVVEDDIWVTGRVGLAAAALSHHYQQVHLSSEVFNLCEKARLRPPIRIEFMARAAPWIHAAQDISDGLLQDLEHILVASGVGARILVEEIPSLRELEEYTFYQHWLLNGGDDYECIFTASPIYRMQLEALAKELAVPLHLVGKITSTQGYSLFNKGRSISSFCKKGFNHFGNPIAPT